MKIAKGLASFLAVLIAAFFLWEFLRKKPVGFSVDPYAQIRRKTGGFSSATWSGDDTAKNAFGYRIILGQDVKPETYDEHERLLASAQAYIKGADIMPSTWEFRSKIMDDFLAFIEENGHLKPALISAGQFLPR